MKRGNVARNEVAEQQRSCWSSDQQESGEEAIRENARKRIVRALPEVVETLLREARGGSALHVKLLFQLQRELTGPGQEGPREKNLEEILTEQWEKDEQKRLLAEG